jgi:hypothetical protein
MQLGVSVSPTWILLFQVPTHNLIPLHSLFLFLWLAALSLSFSLGLLAVNSQSTSSTQPSSTALTVPQPNIFQTVDSDGIYTIYTNYDPDRHKTPCFSGYEKDEGRMYAFTEEERTNAQRATEATSLLDFKFQVFSFLYFVLKES